MRPRTISARFVLPALAILALAAAGCDGDATSPDATVAVTLDDTPAFTLTATPATVPAGRIRFNVSNAGTVQHELMIIRTTLAPNALPTVVGGAYQENGMGTTIVDETSPIPAGQNASLTVNLTAGSYVLICNMVGPGGSHYAAGMRTAFTVT